MADGPADPRHDRGHAGASMAADSRPSRRTRSPPSCSGSRSRFVVLYVIVAQFVLPRMGAILASRRAKIEATSPAARMKGEADAAVAAHEKALAEAHARAQCFGDETRERLAAESEVHRKSVEPSSIAPTRRVRQDHCRQQDGGDGQCARHRRRYGGRDRRPTDGSPPSERAVEAAVDEVLKR